MPLASHYLTRALGLWLLARLLVTAASAMAGASPSGRPLALAPVAALAMVALCALLGLVDVARRGERALLGNHGVSRARLLLWLAVPALSGEVAVAVLLASVR
jgi:hypothetical protein